MSIINFSSGSGAAAGSLVTYFFPKVVAYVKAKFAAAKAKAAAEVAAVKKVL